MISSFLIALREGAEAALVVGIVLVYLDRTGRSRLARFVWSGVALAAALSLAAAIALERWQISEDGFEGLLMLLAAIFVVSMIVWMNRIARHLRKEIEQRVEAFAQKSEFAAGLGLGTFVFLMVLREGAELALILRAVELSAEGVAVWIGTGLGLALAIAVGFFFFEGTLKIPLGRFFAVTSAILMIVALQLALTGFHELSEAMWIPSGKREMAIVGPIVRNEYFFFVVILGAAALLILREWRSMKTAAAPQALNSAEERRIRWERRSQSRWMFTAAAVFVAVILTLTAEFVYGRVAAAAPEAQSVIAQNGIVRISTAGIGDGNLHFFQVAAGNTSLRFIVIRKPDGNWGTALDACMICGWAGYRQSGENVICRNCASAIYIPSIGQSGGCNPVTFPARVDGSDLLIDVSTLTDAARKVPQ
ncbi:MAG TPA: Fe-S-containing protein [Candidatus Acidoferrales bacterium]|nr:Fe-S-containing protein [Candidatus Acidoferrales bacterium]